jgi:hypothetical protein
VSKRRALPDFRIEDLPIPADVSVDARWPASLRELADHVGPRNALLIAEKFGGQQLSVPAKAELSPVLDLIGVTANQAFCWVYGKNGDHRHVFPMAKDQIFAAKAAPFIAAARAGTMSLDECAYILRVDRTHMWRLKQDVTRAGSAEPYKRASKVDPRQIDLVDWIEAAA